MRPRYAFIAFGFAGLALQGCIPRSATSPGFSKPQSARIEPEIATVFDEKPVWEARPVVPAPVPIAPGTYTVQRGDTLFAIGERTGVGIDVMARANGLTPPYALNVGQQLIVPAARVHKVQAGETGIAIARAYGLRWADIIAANALAEPFVLKVGQRLSIPEAVPLPPVARQTATPQIDLEQRAAAFRLDIDDILTGGEPATDSRVASAPPVSQPRRPLAPTVRVGEPSSFNGQFIWPARGTLASRFGPSGSGEINDGIDISVGQGASIRAAGDGVVAFVGSNVAGFGGLILVRHGDGWISAYGRAAQSVVTRGQSVRRGQEIGRAGLGTTPMLHFQLRKARKPVDPLRYLPPTA
jgi:murein DD-endopeptidase MepM/ murein hydrolase activator NlpD